MKRTYLLMGLFLLLPQVESCKKKDTSKEKNTPSAESSGEIKGKKPAGSSGFVEAHGMKPEHEKVKCPSDSACEIVVVTKKVKEALESKKNYKKMTVILSSATTDAFMKTVANIPWVTRLKIESEKISDLSGLARLSDLRRFSMMAGEKVTDLTPLKDAVFMKSIVLQNHKAADLSPLKGMKAMERLDITGTSAKVTDISFLADMKKLRELFIHFYKDVKNISAMENLESLQTLGMMGWTITDIKPLAKLKNLKVLNLKGTPVEDLAPLSGLGALQVLNLQQTAVKSLRPLMKVKSLRSLVVPKGTKKSEIKRLEKAIPGIAITVAKE